jgi:hypothetical protein
MKKLQKGLFMGMLAAILCVPALAFAQEEAVAEDTAAVEETKAPHQVVTPVSIADEAGGDSFKSDLALILSLAGIALLGVYALWDRHNKPA